MKGAMGEDKGAHEVPFQIKRIMNNITISNAGKSARADIKSARAAGVRTSH
jgi:hypothetical protein